LKSPLPGVFKKTKIIWGFHMTNKTSPETSGRTKNGTYEKTI